MRYMFYGCSSLTSLDLGYLNTGNVTATNMMFYGCSGLTSLELNLWNTEKVTNMAGMFNGCSNLQTITVGNGWSTESVKSSANMFKNCSSLVGGQGTTFDASHVDGAYAHVDGGTGNPGYLTAVDNTS